MRSWTLFLGLVSVLVAVQPMQVQAQGVSVVARRDPAGIANDEQAFEAFLKSLPTVVIPGSPPRSFYLMEGDMPMTAEQVRAALNDHASDAKTTSPTGAGELKVMTKGDRPVIWSKGDRTLGYAVNRTSFGTSARYNIVVEGMKAAASAWVDACPTCGLSFVHRSEYDSAPDINKLTFVVAYRPGETAYVAKSFFPYAEQSLRYLWIAPSFFSPGQFSAVGLLRHELGHILGYRHENIGGVPGCQEYEETDPNWKLVTKYESYSVMHYFCGEGGTRDMKLQERDKSDHALTYK